MIVNNLEELKKIAEKFYEKILSKNQNKNGNNALLITLSGDLGAGKTSFVKLFGEILEIKSIINSPTFVISKRHKIPKKKNLVWDEIVHIDAYRLEREEDLELIGLKNDLNNEKKIIFLEWPEKIEKWLPKENRFNIDIKYIDQNSRDIKF